MNRLYNINVENYQCYLEKDVINRVGETGIGGMWNRRKWNHPSKTAKCKLIKHTNTCSKFTHANKRNETELV